MTALLKGREPPKTIAKLAELMSGSQGAEVYLQQLTTAALHRAGHVAAGTGWVLWGGAQLSGARSCGVPASHIHSLRPVLPVLKFQLQPV